MILIIVNFDFQIDVEPHPDLMEKKVVNCLNLIVIIFVIHW